MKMPDVIVVHPHAYHVDVSELAAVELDDAGEWGRLDNDRGRIMLNVSIRPSALREVLLHEVLHACIGQAVPDLDPELEERIVATMTPRLLDALRCSPHLVDVLLEP